MSTFVLLHGGGMGGWTWKFVAKILRDKGHDVYSPTFTGFGERIHLISRDITNATHVADIVNVLTYEDLKDVVLVAHSYAGTVVPGVIAEAGDRVRRVAYLDAMITRNGEAPAEALGFMQKEQAEGTAALLRSGQGPIGSGVHEQQREMAKQHPHRMTREREQWLLDHLSDMPLSCLVNPVIAGADSIKKPINYIAVTETIMQPMHQRARDLGWPVQEVDGDHAILIGEPETTARLLLEFA
jgi:pimeloyl-ACP methyl ester carboxylesterase